MALTQIQPREQEQPLAIESKVLALPTSSEFQGEVTERTGLDGLAALDDATMVCMPDLMTVPPGQKLDLKMVKAVNSPALKLHLDTFHMNIEEKCQGDAIR